MTSRAILVEDLPTIRASLTAALQDLADVDVVAVAETAEEAIAAGRGSEWDVMVLDLFLREGTGLSVLARLQDRPTAQRIIVLTNYATPDVLKRCMSLGAFAVFDKSTQLDEFFLAIAPA